MPCPDGAQMEVSTLLSKIGKPILSQADRAEIARLINDEKLPLSVVATQFKIHPSTVSKIASKAKSRAAYDDDTHLLHGPMPPCPFPEDNHAMLKNKVLTVDERYYLACLVDMKGLKIGRVASQLDIPFYKVQSACNRVRTGKTLERSFGPPGFIDAISDSVLRELSQLEGASRPSLKVMKDHIAAEINKTLERRAVANSTNSLPIASSMATANTATIVAVDSLASDTRKGAAKRRRLFSEACLWKYLARYGYCQEKDPPSNVGGT